MCSCKKCGCVFSLCVLFSCEHFLCVVCVFCVWHVWQVVSLWATCVSITSFMTVRVHAFVRNVAVWWLAKDTPWSPLVNNKHPSMTVISLFVSFLWEQRFSKTQAIFSNALGCLCFVLLFVLLFSCLVCLVLFSHAHRCRLRKDHTGLLLARQARAAHSGPHHHRPAAAAPRRACFVLYVRVSFFHDFLNVVAFFVVFCGFGCCFF